jgi:hypothetical protein
MARYFLDLAQLQEDDTVLGVTWPSKTTKSRQVTQTCQVHRLCHTWPKKKMPRPSLPQGIPIPQTWLISGSWPRHPRHPMSHPSDLRVAQFHCNIVDSIHVSSLYVRQVMTTVTTFKELQLQHGMQIYLPSLFAHSVILSKFKNSFPW